MKLVCKCGHITEASTICDCPFCGRWMKEMLNELETKAGGVQPAIKLLGVSQASYYSYRNGTLTMPVYIECSIIAHLHLSNKNFKLALERRA